MAVSITCPCSCLHPEISTSKYKYSTLTAGLGIRLCPTTITLSLGVLMGSFRDWDYVSVAGANNPSNIEQQLNRGTRTSSDPGPHLPPPASSGRLLRHRAGSGFRPGRCLQVATNQSEMESDTGPCTDCSTLDRASFQVPSAF